MAEGLVTPEGDTIELNSDAVNREFAAAMASSPDDTSAPPKRVKPEVNANEGQTRRRRPPKQERARVTAPKLTTAKASPELDAQRLDGVKGLVQLGAGVCLVMDSTTPEDNISWRADAVTLASSADAIANAVVETARHNSSFAAAVDKVTQAGPYAALVSVGVAVGAQLARNHGVKFGEFLGAKPPEAILGTLEGQPEGEQG